VRGDRAQCCRPTIDVRAWHWRLGAGVAGVIAGVVVLAYSVLGTPRDALVLVHVIAGWAIVSGVLNIVLRQRSVGPTRRLGLGIAQLVVGLMLVANPASVLGRDR
jgi:uncharacterized membrane protein HdeD (DUF308 family)